MSPKDVFIILSKEVQEAKLKASLPINAFYVSKNTRMKLFSLLKSVIFAESNRLYQDEQKASTSTKDFFISREVEGAKITCKNPYSTSQASPV